MDTDPTPRPRHFENMKTFLALILTATFVIPTLAAEPRNLAARLNPSKGGRPLGAVQNGWGIDYYGESDAERGWALLEAKAAASAGDTIHVYANAYVTNSLAKTGVNWWFSPGVTITAAALNAPTNGVHSVWSMDTGDASFVVSGEGTFITTNGWGVKLLGTSGTAVLRGRSFQAVHGTTPGTQAILENGANNVTMEATESLISEGYDGLIKTGPGKVWMRAPYGYSADNPVEITDGGIVTVEVAHWVSAAGISLDSSEVNLNFGTLEITNNGVGAAGGLFAAQAEDRGSIRAERLIVRDPSDTVYYGTNNWIGNLLPGSLTKLSGRLAVLTNAAPSNVTVGTTAPDFWRIQIDAATGLTNYSPAWTNHP